MNINNKVFGTSMIFAFLAACGGGGGGDAGGGDTGTNPAIIPDVAGTWNVTETHNDNCGDGNDVENWVATVTQSGADVTVSYGGVSRSGTLNGSTLTWSGSYPEDGGTTTVTSLTLTFSGNTASGSATWSWTDGTDSCSGTTSISAQRTSGGTSAPSAPTGLAAQATSDSAIQLTWNDVTEEDGYTIQRSITSGSGFTAIATVTANTTSYSDTGLSSATAYYYRIYASNSAGDSGFSNEASAMTGSSATPTPPAAPSGLAAEAIGPRRIDIRWNDNSDNEDGFVVERGIDGNAFSEISRTGPNTGSYSDTAVLDSTTYYYRVAAFNAAGTSGFSQSALATTPASTAQQYDLSVTTAGTGTGTVSGPGIVCGSGGSDCSELFDAQTTVTLNATPDDGSVFNSWSGCTPDPLDDSKCTVQMTSSVLVAANFSVVFSVGATLRIDGDADGNADTTDDDGAFVVSWTWRGLAQVPVPLQESNDPGFSTFDTYLISGNSASFTNKADGMWCYRLSTTFGITDAVCITVLRPQSSEGLLKITNDSSYDIISLVLNGQEFLNQAASEVLPVGQSAVFSGPPMNVTGTLVNGFYDCVGCFPNELFIVQVNTTISAGETTEVRFENPSIERMLTLFGSSAIWKGEWWDSNIFMHFAIFEFFENGSWNLYTCPFGGSPQLIQSGSSVTLVRWSPYSVFIDFRIGTDPEQLQLNMADGFSSFFMDNGPPSWPKIQYVAQVVPGSNPCL